MSVRRMLSAPFVLGIGVVLILSGCGKSKAQTTTTTGAVTTTTRGQSTTTVAAGTATTTASGDTYADGRWSADITAIDATHDTVSIDIVQFLTGDAANAAYAKDNPDADDKSAPDDHYTVNASKKVRTFPLDPKTVTVMVSEQTNSDSGEGQPDLETISFNRLVALHNAKRDSNVFWFTLKGNHITKIEEQWVP